MRFDNLELLNPTYVHSVEENTEFFVVEGNSNGSGVCRFISGSPALFIKAKDQAPVVWSLRNRKCAEAAFVVGRSENEADLHVVEMKSKLSLSEFVKVIEQWRGMYLSALATLGVIKAPPPQKVYVYVAYKRESVLNVDPAQPVLMKVLVGGEQMKGIREWQQGHVDLHHGVRAKIIKGVRSPDDCDFGMV